MFVMDMDVPCSFHSIIIWRASSMTSPTKTFKEGEGEGGEEGDGERGREGEHFSVTTDLSIDLFTRKRI